MSDLRVPGFNPWIQWHHTVLAVVIQAAWWRPRKLWGLINSFLGEGIRRFALRDAQATETQTIILTTDPDLTRIGPAFSSLIEELV